MRRVLCWVLVCALTLGLCGCGAQQEPGNGKLQVVCTLFPYYDFVRQIGGDAVDVTLLVAAGKETHSFEPTPLDVVKIAECDVFICNGGESEVWVDDLLDASGENIQTVVHVMDGLDLLEEEIVEGMQVSEHHDHDGDEESEEHHNHEEESGEHHHEEEEIEYDEHIWTSPVMAKAICKSICDALCEADNVHAPLYRQHLTDYLTELGELDEAFRAVIADAQRTTLVFGDRFPLLYFCRTYGLDYRAAFHGCASDTEPSLATLKYLIDLVSEENIPIVYTIELSNQKIAEAIAETTGAQVRTFQSCQSVSRRDFEAGATYLSLMWQNVEALREGVI